MSATPTRRAVIVGLAAFAGAVAVAALSLSAGGDSQPHAAWCAAFNDVFEGAFATMSDESLQDVPLNEIETISEPAARLHRLGAPTEIRNDFATLIEAERYTVEGRYVHPDKYWRADAAVYSWVLDNCLLSAGVRHELRGELEERLDLLASVEASRDAG